MLTLFHILEAAILAIVFMVSLFGLIVMLLASGSEPEIFFRRETDACHAADVSENPQQPMAQPSASPDDSATAGNSLQ